MLSNPGLSSISMVPIFGSLVVLLFWGFEVIPSNKFDILLIFNLDVEKETSSVFSDSQFS